MYLFRASRTSESRTAVQEWGARYLAQQEKLKRPLSPHLSIYKPQLTWGISGIHRIVGCLMGGSERIVTLSTLFRFDSLALLVGGLGFAVLPITYEQVIERIRSWNLPSPIIGAFKFTIAYLITFYSLSGLRLLVSLQPFKFCSIQSAQNCRRSIWPKAPICRRSTAAAMRSLRLPHSLVCSSC